MIVSWNWLREYVQPGASVDEVGDRLALSGLNLESITPMGDDFAVDLEVTSNRPDCLGHLGVAREVAALYGQPLCGPKTKLNPVQATTSSCARVSIEATDLCPQYIARVIRGVQIGPSPAWLQQRLEAIGINPVNNVVDVTNYVLMECGQPLHAFDLAKLAGPEIVVRRARDGETLQAIDHAEYKLTPDMCVIADAERPVAVAGVMGGAGTEISDDTTDLLIETANFASASVRATARGIRRADANDRRKGLHSDSSYRFERGVDVQQLMWASDRCCQLILEVAGGELLSDPIVAGEIPAWTPEPVTLRIPQIARLLGITIPIDEVTRILAGLGLTAVESRDPETQHWLPPSWRRDLTRECDLIEEIARLHGYDRIPEDRDIPVVSGTRSRAEQVTDRIRNFLCGTGFHETLTLSFTPRELGPICDPAPQVAATLVEPAAGEFGNQLRKSLIPSLISVRRDNERKGNLDARLFEIARGFRDPRPERPESQPLLLGLVSGHSFAEMRGVLTGLLASCGIAADVQVEADTIDGLLPGRTGRISVDGKTWGYLGELNRDSKGAAPLKLRDAAMVAEVSLSLLIEQSRLVPQAEPLPSFPAVLRDLNFVLDEAVTWRQLEGVVRGAAKPLLHRVGFVDQYRGKQLPSGKKSYVIQVEYLSPERTLTGEEVEAAQQSVIQACANELGAELR
ncbi:MAG: phenylalanine--tRNA ligase subunit beta [Planctomycetaceae bacterium]